MFELNWKPIDSVVDTVLYPQVACHLAENTSEKLSDTRTSIYEL